MNLEVRGVHFEVSDHIRETIDKKLPRIGFAKELIVDLLLTLTKAREGYRSECTINFRWGTSAHLRVDSVGLMEGLDILFDKLDQKVRKEKEKIQDHSAISPKTATEE